MTATALVSCIDSRVETLTKFYGRFQLGPFAAGQALTVANALRRALLSQLSGTAITLLEIQGVSNEYEVLNGMRESVLDLLLNFKQVVLTSDFEIFSPQVGFLNVQGPGIIRARDLKLPSFIYVVDPNQYIATLNSQGRLTLKFLICCGKNYLTTTPNQEPIQSWMVLLQQATPVLSLSKVLKTVDFTNQPQSKTPPNGFAAPGQAFSGLTKEFPFQNSMNSEENQDGFGRFASQSSEGFYHQWKMNRESVPPKGGYAGSQELSNLKKKNTPRNLETEFLSLTTQRNSLGSALEATGQCRTEGVPLPQTNQVNSTFEKTPCKKGVFPVDAVFMPVTRVNYLIESTDEFREPDEFLNSLKDPKVFQGSSEQTSYSPFADRNSTDLNPIEHLPKSTERILLEIWTNGSLHPRQAIHKASKSLIEIFLPFQQMRTSFFQPRFSQSLKDTSTPVENASSFSNSSTKPKQPQTSQNQAVDSLKNSANGNRTFEQKKKDSTQIFQNSRVNVENGKDKQVKTKSKKKFSQFKNPQRSLTENLKLSVLQLDIGNLELTARPYSCLKLANIHTIQDLLAYSKEDLLLVKNFGQRSLVEVENALQKWNFRLKKS